MPSNCFTDPNRAARYNFDCNSDEDPRLAESRALACELIAWQFLTYLSERELIDHLLYELPAIRTGIDISIRTPSIDNTRFNSGDELTPLLGDSEPETHPSTLKPPKRNTKPSNLSSTNLFLRDQDADVDELAESMAGMNALEIAAVANAKKFLSQKPVQKIIEDIWNGNIIFWDSLSARATKSPKIYNEHTADPFSRLRVPKYQKAFQVAFFIAFLVLYYAVLVQRSTGSVTATEIFLYIWIAAFAYDEFSELRDAGFLFYQTDFWSAWDIAIILVGLAFFVTRIIGLVKKSDHITDIAFDILSMAALFLVPRWTVSILLLIGSNVLQNLFSRLLEPIFRQPLACAKGNGESQDSGKLPWGRSRLTDFRPLPFANSCPSLLSSTLASSQLLPCWREIASL